MTNFQKPVHKEEIRPHVFEEEYPIAFFQYFNHSEVWTNLAVILQCRVTEQIPNTKEEEQAMEES